jgi:hypothetical protein
MVEGYYYRSEGGAVRVARSARCLIPRSMRWVEPLLECGSFAGDPVRLDSFDGRRCPLVGHGLLATPSVRQRLDGRGRNLWGSNSRPAVDQGFS